MKPTTCLWIRSIEHDAVGLIHLQTIKANSSFVRTTLQNKRARQAGKKLSCEAWCRHQVPNRDTADSWNMIKIEKWYNRNAKVTNGGHASNGTASYSVGEHKWVALSRKRHWFCFQFIQQKVINQTPCCDCQCVVLKSLAIQARTNTAKLLDVVGK